MHFLNQATEFRQDPETGEWIQRPLSAVEVEETLRQFSGRFNPETMELRSAEERRARWHRGLGKDKSAHVAPANEPEATMPEIPVEFPVGNSRE